MACCATCGLPEAKHVPHVTEEELRAANITVKLTIKYDNYREALWKLTIAELEEAATTINNHKRPGWRWRLEFAVRHLKERIGLIPTAWARILDDSYPDEHHA